MIGILLSYLSVKISPERCWILPFFGLFYPYFFFINLSFFLFWIFRKDLFSILILFVMLLGWNQISNTYQLPPGNRQHGKKNTMSKSLLTKAQNISSGIRVLSYNVHLFNSFNPEHSDIAPGTIIDFIAERNADIICLQEVYFSVQSGLTTEILKKKLTKTPYSYIQFSHTENSGRKYGLAIFSAFPIVNRGEVRFSNTFNLSIFADIVVRGDTLRVFNNHLQSFLLGSRNVRFLTSPPGKNDEALEDIQDISLRMRSAFIKRADQADLLSRHIQEAPYPVIVCGDFNDTPVSYTYHKLSEGLKDAFVESGSGFGKTYSQIFPSYRIDYILFSPGFSSSEFNIIRNDYSDHFPVYCTLSFKVKS